MTGLSATGSKWEIYGANAGTGYSMKGMGWIALQNPSSFLYHFSYLGDRGGSTVISCVGTVTLDSEITQISVSGGTFDNGDFSLLYI